MQNRSLCVPRRSGGYLLSAAVALAALSGCVRLKQPQSPPTSAAGGNHMDTAAGAHAPAIEPAARPNAVFEADGQPYCFQGTNNYYLNFKSRAAVDDVFARAKRLGLRVMRMWAYIDRGSLDNRVPPVDPGDRKDGTKEGCYTQYWDSRTKQPAYNDGPTGLETVDYALHAARQSGIKVIMVLTNNWRDFGGMDQYLTWYGLNQHHLFYTDARVRQAYKNWAGHLVFRRNAVNGVLYRDDPTIFAWELANEPRIRNYRDYDSVQGWDLTTIPRWAGEMSQFIHSIDPNHMVSVGDEGQFAEGKQGDLYSGKDGVDHRALLAIKSVDFGTFHLYPETWGTGTRWSYDWIKDHIEAAYAAKKPTVLEEYGLIVKRGPSKGLEPGKPIYGEERRLRTYRVWNDMLLQGGAAGAMFWILVGRTDSGDIYPDYDHFTVYEGEKSAELIHQYATKFANEARACLLAPAADGPPSPFVRIRHLPELKAVSSVDEQPRVNDGSGWLALR